MYVCVCVCVCACPHPGVRYTSFLLQVESRLPRSDKLKNMVKAGIPHSLRPHIWLRVSGALEKRKKSETNYKEIVKASSNDHLMTSKQIEKVSCNVCAAVRRERIVFLFAKQKPINSGTRPQYFDQLCRNSAISNMCVSVGPVDMHRVCGQVSASLDFDQSTQCPNWTQH